jgi:hypothetical protein
VLWGDEQMAGDSLHRVEHARRADAAVANLPRNHVVPRGLKIHAGAWNAIAVAVHAG